MKNGAQIIDINRNDHGYTVIISVIKLKTKKSYHSSFVDMTELREKYPNSIIRMDAVDRFMPRSLTPV